MPEPITSRAAAIAAKCRECIHDPMSAGTWREQVAACTSANCPLHDLRPVPRSCMAGRFIDREAIASLRVRLDKADRSSSMV